MATTLDGFSRPQAAARGATRAGTTDFAWHAYALFLSAMMVAVGIIWDISWHMSIGRDTFWTPAHLLIQGGGLIAGFGSGLLALYITFRGTAEEKASAVSFWGFRAPFGAWVAILGCGAMLTSAPFDDWWHNAYGLDVRIVSPPHELLGLGMMWIILGALLRTLALQNGADDRTRSRAALLFSASSGLMVIILAVLFMEWSDWREMHLGTFYRTMSLGFPVILVAVAVAGRSRWPATIAAAVYMIVFAGTSWVLMLFPAVPKLGPIYQNITHYVPLDFPLLLVVPALALDLTWRRVREWPAWRAALALGAAFLIPFLMVQWPFADLMMQHGRNWFFHIDNFVYWQNPSTTQFAYFFRPTPRGDWPLIVQLLIAFVSASVAALVGRGRGLWMTRVRR